MSLSFDSFVLAATTASLATEPTAREYADAVEFRMDLATDPLAALASYDGALPVIATNRATWEGGEADGDSSRLDALCRAVEHESVAAVDVELATIEDGDGQRVVGNARANEVSVIASTHDFQTTPSPEALGDLLGRASAAGDVGKLAVTAESPADVLAVLEATWAATSDGERVATMAMGEPGRHSRAVAPQYGSKIGYAPVDPADATAPGQYGLATLSTLVLGLRDGDFDRQPEG
jgi:3-dehydroquinate dehydratase-1